MRNEVRFNVKVVKNGSSKPNEYKEYAELLKGSSKQNVCINLLKIEFSKWVQPLVINTNISIIEVTDKIIDNIELNTFYNGYSRTNKLFAKIVFGGLVRIAMEASNITNIDHASTLNAIYNEVEITCNEIIELLNSN